MGVQEGSSTLNTEDTIKLIPTKTYRAKFCVDGLKALAALDDHPNDLVGMLFSEEELQWMKQRLTSH